ncbi:MAG: hypothetical protein M1482_11845 [Chloroflexi bacterium]|nr:hypothetical protein [Chloroflexota bacterium]
MDASVLENHFHRLVLVTQNIDGLHIAAGSRDVIELHGNLMRDKCSWQGNVVDRTQARPAPNGMLACPQCEALLRPDVVWFGEALPRASIERAFAEASACDAFLSIGTSAVVEPAASLPRLAKKVGAFLVEINLSDTPISAIADIAVRAKSGEFLPGLVTELGRVSRTDPLIT